MTDLSRIVPRIVNEDENTQLYTATHLILSVPFNKVVDSIAVMPGLGEHQRVITAIELWQTNEKYKHLFVSGTYKEEREQPQLTLDLLQEEPFNLKRLKGAFAQVEALHTREQADWIVKQIITYDVKSLAVVVSHWHITRAYRTLLKSMLDSGIRIPLYPVVVSSSPTQIVPEFGQTVSKMSAGEVERNKKYAENGQIATYNELIEYLDWLWKQT